ncbi:MAG: hypothetical protein ACREPE_08130 [Lysobacter sp.]
MSEVVAEDTMAPASEESPVASPQLQAAEEETGPEAASVAAWAALLPSLAPIFRAAMLYPGLNSDPAAWALAVGTMSDASSKLANQLAVMRRDEMDVDWARSELHPPIVTIVADYWVQSLLRSGGAASIADIVVNPDEIMAGLMTAERAIHAHGPLRPAGMPLTMEADLLATLSMVVVYAQRYAAVLSSQVSISLSIDTYIYGVCDALLAAADSGAQRAERHGIEPSGFRRALLQSAVGIVSTAAEAALHATLQRVADVVNQGGDVSSALIDDGMVQGFPMAESADRIAVGVNRLAGTCLYVVGKVGAANGR